MKRLLLLSLGLLVAAGCGPSESPPQKAAARLGKAEAVMEACKQRNGLAATPTPSTVILDDPAARGQTVTPEMADQLRMKVQCRLELDELLAARREAGGGR